MFGPPSPRATEAAARVIAEAVDVLGWDQLASDERDAWRGVALDALRSAANVEQGDERMADNLRPTTP